jgi:hypothetical protein
MNCRNRLVPVPAELAALTVEPPERLEKLLMT